VSIIEAIFCPPPPNPQKLVGWFPRRPKSPGPARGLFLYPTATLTHRGITVSPQGLCAFGLRRGAN
jgi:hypothetical protein